jgi:POT family proton-dependent oligopeptide transporter
MRRETQPLFRNILYLSLATIIAGVGFLKANVSALVGSLYGARDRRRDSGFTIFYMGINLGGFLAERDRMLVAIYVILAQIPFVALYEQAGSSFNLFTDRLVDRTIAGWTVPAPMFQSLDPAFIFLLAPVLAWLWVKLARDNLEPSTPIKLSLAVCAVGLSFLALVAGMKLSGPTGPTALGFVVLVYLINTIGELLLVPVSLSAMTQLSPAKLGGLMMGAWFLYSGMSNFVAGLVAQATGAMTVGGAIADIGAAKANYEAVYGHTALAAIAAGVAMFLLSPLLTKLMHAEGPGSSNF